MILINSLIQIFTAPFPLVNCVIFS